MVVQVLISGTDGRRKPPGIAENVEEQNLGHFLPAMVLKFSSESLYCFNFTGKFIRNSGLIEEASIGPQNSLKPNTLRAIP